MSDEESYPPPLPQFIQDVLKILNSMPHIEPPPADFIEAARALQPYTGTVLAAMVQLAAFNRVAGIGDRQRAAFAEMAASLTATHRLTVPTAGELVEADEDLRTRVLPETSEDELEKAVSKIPADPEKVKLAALLASLIDQATGVPGSSPWVLFVVVFCMALRADPDVVNALALALAVLAVMQGPKTDG